MIAMEELRFAYGDGGFELRVDDLAIDAGEHVACIGPSGTGKTTLVNLVAGILVADRGRVLVDGQDLALLADGERRRFRISNVGLVFQEFELLEYLSALENILLPYHVTGHLVADPPTVDRARGLADSMGLGPVLARRPRRLSQGERQRVAICRALITEPKLLMCDEPTGNLDPRTAGVTLDLLFERVKERDATLLMVTHNHGILDRFGRVLDVTELGVATA
ncbi:MAG: ABC transporter ATP-binding protein [Planctomycetes bacterium]|nr:ABC transporter ATP-binding protein [Planctomycetota bacterium]